MKFRFSKFAPLFVFVFGAGALEGGQGAKTYPTIGGVVQESPGLERLLDLEAPVEVLAGGFTWIEGPVWDRREGCLYFSEIPKNTVFRWEDGKGVSLYLKPSGFTGVSDPGNEPGSNGLLIDDKGRLISCEHGDRRLSVLTEGGGKRTLADNYGGKRFNSPNDIARRANGDLYFTDPIYGLPGKERDPRREMDFCGVFRLSVDGEVTLLTDRFTRPNGIAFSPDEKTLYVAQSDRNEPVVMAFPVEEDGTLGEGRVFFDATELAGEKRGLPDGLKVDVEGNLFATGPGGVLVLSPEGKLLGRIETGELVSNVAWGGDGSDLYLTSDMYLCRIRTKTKGAGW